MLAAAAAVPAAVAAVLTNPMDNFYTLAIETSCDDTAVALLKGASTLVAGLLSSQIESHSVYGGVVPELASRMHQEAILPLLREVLAAGGIQNPAEEIDLLAVTSGPGLMGSLLVGLMTAKGLSQAWGIPLIGVNHLEGHLFANLLEYPNLTCPFICGIFSGGHSELVLVKAFGDYELLGATRDDAAGEAYDKAAKLLGLGYPGGPIVDRLASQGDPDAFVFPIPLKGTHLVEFSFSGLKTALLTAVRRLQKEEKPLPLEDLCASFQKAVTASLMDKITLAVKQTGVKRVALSGGVAANSALRSRLSEEGAARKWEVFIPPRGLCTDNAAMIAAAGYASYHRGHRSDLNLVADPSWSPWS